MCRKHYVIDIVMVHHNHWHSQVNTSWSKGLHVSLVHSLISHTHKVLCCAFNFLYSPHEFFCTAHSPFYFPHLILIFLEPDLVALS